MSYLFQESLVLNPGFFLFTVQRSASLYTVVLFDFVIWGGEKKKHTSSPEEENRYYHR